MTKESSYFKSFCKVSKAFGTTARRDDLLKLIVESVVDTMDGKAACLYLADKGQNVFKAMAQTGLSENYLHASPEKARGFVEVLEKNGYQSYLDATTDPRLDHHEAKKAEGIASLLTVPVRAGNRIIGALCLYTAEKREFDSYDIDFLCALADQAGIAIENNRLHRRMQRNTMLFLDFSANINSSLEIHDILNKLTVDICDKLGMKGAVIRLLDEDLDEMKVVASYGVSEAFLEKGHTTTIETARRALKGETIVINDIGKDNRIAFRKAMEEEGIVSMIVAPIPVRDKVIGVLRLYSGFEREYPDDVLMLVKALAHQGGLAIQNASMFLQLQEDKKSLEADVWSYRSWF